MAANNESQPVTMHFLSESPVENKRCLKQVEYDFFDPYRFQMVDASAMCLVRFSVSEPLVFTRFAYDNIYAEANMYGMFIRCSTDGSRKGHEVIKAWSRHLDRENLYSKESENPGILIEKDVMYELLIALEPDAFRIIESHL